jgi:DNA-binding MarR family transcriptional regulator
MPAAESTPSSELPDVLQFMQLLWAVVHGLERTSKRMAGEIGVTGPQRLVLRVVGLLPGVSAGDLAAVLHVHPSTLTGVVQRLAAQRLLTRAHDPRDRRRAILSLTTRGARANGATRGTVEEAIAEALEGIGERDRLASKRVLTRLAAQLERSVSRASPQPSRGGRRRRSTRTR